MSRKQIIFMTFSINSILGVFVQELFKLSTGESWFARVNGNCVKHPRSKASDLTSVSLPRIELGSNRDITTIALVNLKVILSNTKWHLFNGASEMT